MVDNSSSFWTFFKYTKLYELKLVYAFIKHCKIYKLADSSSTNFLHFFKLSINITCCTNCKGYIDFLNKTKTIYICRQK